MEDLKMIEKDTEEEVAVTNPPPEEDVTEKLLQTEHVEDVAPGSEEEAEIRGLLEQSYLDTGFENKWRPAKIQRINNTTMAAEYEEKKQDYLIRGRRDDEMVEAYGFMVENNVASLELTCTIGMQCRDSEYNALGYNRMGVYLCRHADVCLQHALVKYSGCQVLRVVMCKYIPGRQTTAIPRVASASEFIEPTQGFDCHSSVIPPCPSDSLQNQFDRSQVYLFEINKLLQPSTRPRQILPLAIVSYTAGGAYIPAIDAEPTTAEKLAGNPRLQQIVNAINNKDSPSGQTTPGGSTLSPGPVPSPSNSLPLMTPHGPVSLSPGEMMLPGMPGMPVTGAPLLQQGPAPGSLLLNGDVNGLGVGPHRPGSAGGLPRGLPLHEMAGGGDPRLQHIISQISAKLEAQDGRKAGNDLPPQRPTNLPAYTTCTTAGGLTLNGAIGMMANAAAPHTGVMPGGLPANSLGLMSHHSPLGSPGLQNGLLCTQPGAGGQNGLTYSMAGAYTLPHMSLPKPPVIPSASHYALGGAGLLGSIPSARSTALASLPGSRPLTPDLQGAGTYLPSNTLPQGLLSMMTSPGAGGMMMTSSMTQPGSSLASQSPYLYGSPFLQEPAKIPGLYYPAMTPAATALHTGFYGQGLVLNQAMKRPLSDVNPSIADKRVKYI